MSSRRSPQTSRALWCLSHWSWVILGCLLVGAALPLVLDRTDELYEADALVYARQLTVNPLVLPRLAEDVFADGTVEARVAAELDLGGSSSDVIPDRLSVIAPEDSIVLVVQGRDAEPEVAARMATLGAQAFVEELNRLGAGVGEFALQAEAIVPTEPLPRPSLVVRMTLGALAGTTVGLGLVCLIAALRRPIVAARDVEDATQVPLLGTVSLPAHRGPGYSGPLGARGIATVTRRIASVPPGRVMVVSSPEDRDLRQRIFVMCGVGLWTLRLVRLDAPEQLVEAVRELCSEHRAAGGTVHARSTAADNLTLVDGGSPIDAFGRTRGSISIVAVARLGIPRRRLQSLAADFTGNGLIGIVLVDARGRSRSGGPARAATASPPARPPLALAG